MGKKLNTFNEKVLAFTMFKVLLFYSILLCFLLFTLPTPLSMLIGWDPQFGKYWSAASFKVEAITGNLLCERQSNLL